MTSLVDDIAAMLHYRGRVLHPRSHPKASGGPCDECIESARQAAEFAGSGQGVAPSPDAPGRAPQLAYCCKAHMGIASGVAPSPAPVPEGHPYETASATDATCVHCGVVGSYGHTAEYQTRYPAPVPEGLRRLNREQVCLRQDAVLFRRFAQTIEQRSPESAVSHIARWALAAAEDIDALLAAPVAPDRTEGLREAECDRHPKGVRCVCIVHASPLDCDPPLPVAPDRTEGLLLVAEAAQYLVGSVELGERHHLMLDAASKVNRALAALDLPVDDDGLMADMDGRGRRADVRGDRHPQALLTAEAVAEIRASRQTKALASKYGVSERTIRAVRSGERWPHV